MFLVILPTLANHWLIIHVKIPDFRQDEIDDKIRKMICYCYWCRLHGHFENSAFSDTKTLVRKIYNSIRHFIFKPNSCDPLGSAFVELCFAFFLIFFVVSCNFGFEWVRLIVYSYFAFCFFADTFEMNAFFLLIIHLNFCLSLNFSYIFFFFLLIIWVNSSICNFKYITLNNIIKCIWVRNMPMHWLRTLT